MTTFRRGDVIRVHFPFALDGSDDPGLKARPALVLHADGFRNRHDEFIVAMITSQTRYADDGCIRVDAGTPEFIEMALEIDSLIALNTLACVKPEGVVRRMGRCTFMDLIDQLLANILGLSTPNPT